MGKELVVKKIKNICNGLSDEGEKARGGSLEGGGRGVRGDALGRACGNEGKLMRALSLQLNRTGTSVGQDS